MIQMVEPVTASIGVYLLTRPHHVGSHVVRPGKLCRWARAHRGELLGAVREELAEPVYNLISHCPPAWAAALYIVLLVMVFFF